MAEYKIPTLLTINDFCEKHTFMSPAALRNKIFNSSGNGMDKFKVTVKLGKRVYINEENFFRWIDAQNGGSNE